jgi:hypothetical protein
MPAFIIREYASGKNAGKYVMFVWSVKKVMDIFAGGCKTRRFFYFSAHPAVSARTLLSLKR